MWYTHRKSVLHATANATSTEHTFSKESTRCERVFRCFSCSRSSSPWCPQLILPLSILLWANVYEEEKNRHRESKRDSKPEIETRRIPRTTHILSLSRCIQRKRETNERNKKRTKSIPRETIEGFSPTHNEFSFLYIERLCLFEYKANTENKTENERDRKSLDPLPSVSLKRSL